MLAFPLPNGLRLRILIFMSKAIAIFIPPLSSMSGGLWVLLQVGEHLARLGHAVSFVIHEQGAALPLYTSIRQKTSLPLMSWGQAGITDQHVWIVPEGWTHALILGLRVGARCIVYMQNWAFGLRALPENVSWHQLPVEFLHVSEPVRLCLKEITGKDGPILRPGIDTTLFYPPQRDMDAAAQGKIRIAWMPRKNKGLGAQIIDAFTQRCARSHAYMEVEWVEIVKIPHEKVGEVLRSCHIFLLTGFPEGCPLPPLEAMASGCIPVGFTGLGGWDYMRQAAQEPYLAKPFFTLQPTPADVALAQSAGFDSPVGNGFFVEDAHVLAATLALEHAALLVHKGGEALALVRKHMALTVQGYTLEKQYEQIQRLEPFFTA